MVGEAVKEIFQKSRIGSRRAVVAIAGQAVIVRHIKMPFMNQEELKQAIPWEAERYIPFPIEEVTLDYKMISSNEEQTEMEVILVCAHNDIILSHLETLKQVGIQPLAMDIQPFALMRTFGLESSVSNESIALLDIGAGTSDLTIVKNGVPRFTRIIPVAGSRFTQMISKNLALDYIEAERLKITTSDAMYNFANAMENSNDYRVNFSMMEGLKELVMELRRSFDYYQLQQRNEKITQLLVSGGGSKIKNLIDYLNSELSIPTSSGLLLRKIDCADKINDEFHQALPMLTVSLGLALREVVEDED